MDMVRAERPAAAVAEPAPAVHTVGEFQGFPALGGQLDGERLFRQLTRGRGKGAPGAAVVVPAGAGAGRPADQPCLAAAGSVQPDPGAAFGVEGERGDERGVGGGAEGEAEECGGAGAMAGGCALGRGVRARRGVYVGHGNRPE